MDNQLIYNTVKAHLNTMFQPSKIGGTCLYRGADGAKCAVGALISDNDYEERMEGHYASNVVNHLFPADQLPLLDDLQEVHDCPGSWNYLGFIGHERLENVARSYNLEP